MLIITIIVIIIIRLHPINRMLRIANATSNPKENENNLRKWKRNEEILNNQFKTDENWKNGERSNRIKIRSDLRRNENEIKSEENIYVIQIKGKRKKIIIKKFKKKTWNAKRQKDRRGGRKEVESRASLSICVSTKHHSLLFFLFFFFIPLFFLFLS